jgi:hypothetical protein
METYYFLAFERFAKQLLFSAASLLEEQERPYLFAS